MDNNKIRSKKQQTVFLLAGFSLLSFSVGYLIVLFQLPEALLFLLLIPIIYSVFNYSDWVVYLLIAISGLTIVPVNFYGSSEFPFSLLPSIVTFFAVGSMLILLMRRIRALQKTNSALNERFRAVADHSFYFEFWEKPDGSFAYVSPSCEQITGYPASDFIDKPALFYELILPEDRFILKNENLTSKKKQIQGNQFEFRITHKNGQVRWVEHVTRKIFSEDGRWLGKRATNIDITDRKAGYSNLRIRFERLMLALEGSEDGVWDLSIPDGQIQFTPQYATLLGFKTDDVNHTLKELHALIHPDDLPAMLDAFKNHLQWKTSSYQAEYRLLTRYGKWRWVLDRGKVIEQDHNGKPVRVVGTHVDITERKSIENALQESEIKFRQLAENMREVFWLRERDSGKFIYVSPAFTAIWGRPTKHLYQEQNIFVESIHWEDFSRVYHSLKELVSSGVIFNEEYRIIQPDGTVRWVWSRAYPIYDVESHYYRIAGIAEDISDRKQAEVAMRDSEKRYRDLIEHQGGGVGIIDPQQTIVYMNPAGEELFGVPCGTMVSRNLKEFLSEDQFTFINAQDNIRQQGIESTYEVTIIRKDNEKRSLLITTTPRFDVNGQFLGAIIIFRDITKRKETEDKLRYIGLHDSLTGLNNRTYFEEEIERMEINGIFPVSVLMSDVDGLKQVNDELGHTVGDDLLQKAARILKKSLRGDDIVARIGGDEFVALMPNSDQNALHHVLSRINTNVSLENEQGNNPFVLSLSVGGYTCTQRGELREAIKLADERMYETKRDHKSNQFFIRLPFNNKKK